MPEFLLTKRLKTGARVTACDPEIEDGQVLGCTVRLTTGPRDMTEFDRLAAEAWLHQTYYPRVLRAKGYE